MESDVCKHCATVGQEKATDLARGYVIFPNSSHSLMVIRPYYHYSGG